MRQFGTPRLRLRPVTPDDAGRLAALDADPEVMRFVSGGAPTDPRHVRDWVIPRMQAQHRDHGTGMWLIFAAGDGDFLGWVTVRTPRHSRAGEAELSYRLARSAWGHGYAAEASAAVIARAFTDTPVERIFAGTHVGHRASRRVMERLGMRLAADTDVTGLDDPDAVVEYELLRDHWAASRGRHAAPYSARHARTG